MHATLKPAEENVRPLIIGGAVQEEQEYDHKPKQRPSIADNNTSPALGFGPLAQPKIIRIPPGIVQRRPESERPQKAEDQKDPPKRKASCKFRCLFLECRGQAIS